MTQKFPHFLTWLGVQVVCKKCRDEMYTRRFWNDREKRRRKKERNRESEENDLDFSRCANCSVHCALRTAHSKFVWGRSECATWLVNHSFEPIRALDVQINMAWVAEDTLLLEIRFTSFKTQDTQKHIICVCHSNLYFFYYSHAHQSSSLTFGALFVC